MEAAVALLMVYTRAPSSPESFVQNLLRIPSICSDVPKVFGYSGLDPDGLWPQEYDDLDRQVTVACQMYEDLSAESPPDAGAKWAAYAIVINEQLGLRRDALPDYSPAQLRRAIEARQ
jgi:hypothetical protein